MSYIVKLLQGAKVEWKPLGEVCHVFSGYAFQAKYFNNAGEGLPLIRIRDINTGFSETYYSGDYDERFLVNNGDILIGMDGDFRAVRWKHSTALMNQRVCRLQDFKFNIVSDFIFYLVQGELDSIHGKIQGSTVKHLSSGELSRSLIPIPPLEVQKEIARILDKFTELTTALTTELTARKKQYSYYREQLFYFDEKRARKERLGIVGEFQRGKRFVKNDMVSIGVPCIHYGEMYTHYGTWAKQSKSFLGRELVENKNLRVAENGDLVIVAAGETIEDIGMGTAWLGKEGVVIHDACFSYRSSLNPKYVAYFTRTKQYHDQIKMHISSGKISAINAKGLEKVLIPVPPPEEQARIVSILDKFDTLTTSISEGLPKEIELRKKQYEYYRDLLLTFPKNNKVP